MLLPDPLRRWLPVVEPGGGGGLFYRIHLDVPLITGVVLLCGFGLIVLYSASDQSGAQVERQLFRFGLAFMVMIAVAQVSPEKLRRWAPWLFVGGVLMLLAVLAVGDIGKGAKRWLDLGVIRFQPSEILKLAVPMVLAWYMSSRPLPATPWRALVAVGITLLPVLLIAKQPDLGTALLVASAGVFVLFLSGVRWRLLFAATALLAALAPVLWFFMRPYQRQRVLTFLNPESDPLGAGYHIIQSQIAIGSGGMYGKGWFRGTQSHLEFLPERHTDFILAVLGEEFGLVGILVLLCLYLFIVLRGLYIANHAQEAFGRLLAGSLTLVFFVYVFVNSGMVTGLLPVVGVPLPMVSYGGTSLVTIMAGFGMLMSIHTHRKLVPL